MLYYKYGLWRVEVVTCSITSKQLMAKCSLATLVLEMGTYLFCAKVKKIKSVTYLYTHPLEGVLTKKLG